MYSKIILKRKSLEWNFSKCNFMQCGYENFYTEIFQNTFFMHCELWKSLQGNFPKYVFMQLWAMEILAGKFPKTCFHAVVSYGNLYRKISQNMFLIHCEQDMLKVIGGNWKKCMKRKSYFFTLFEYIFYMFCIIWHFASSTIFLKSRKILVYLKTYMKI